MDNFENEWVYKTKFDYIHGRELEGAVGDERKLFKQIFDNLNPGGYVEFDAGYAYARSEDGTHDKAENVNLWLKTGRDAAEKFGKSFENVPKWKSFLEETGFVNVTQETHKV